MLGIIVIQNKFKEISEAYPYSAQTLKLVLNRFQGETHSDEVEMFCHELTLGEYDGLTSVAAGDCRITYIDLTIA